MDVPLIHNRTGSAKEPKENTMANLITLVLPLAFTFAIAAWGPLSTRDREKAAREGLRNRGRQPFPCEGD
jgi:hypothetical protein